MDCPDCHPEPLCEVGALDRIRTRFDAVLCLEDGQLGRSRAPPPFRNERVFLRAVRVQRVRVRGAKRRRRGEIGRGGCEGRVVLMHGRSRRTRRGASVRPFRVAVLVQRNRRIVCPSRRRLGVCRHGNVCRNEGARGERGSRAGGGRRENEGVPCGRLKVSWNCWRTRPRRTSDGAGRRAEKRNASLARINKHATRDLTSGT